MSLGSLWEDRFNKDSDVLLSNMLTVYIVVRKGPNLQSLFYHTECVCCSAKGQNRQSQFIS